MNIEQKQYKEMFDEVGLSEDKKAKLEEVMRKETGCKRRINFRKMLILGACTVTILSSVCIAGAQVAKDTREKTEKEMLVEKGDVITDDSRGEEIPNKVTPDTKEITMLVDGQPVVWEIDASQYLDENGQVDMRAFNTAVMDGYMAYINQLYFNNEEDEWNYGGASVICGADKEGNSYYEAKTPAIPINPYAWGIKIYNGNRYLMVPGNAEFDETVYLTELAQGHLGILLPFSFEIDEPIFIDFRYNGEEYTIAVLKDNKLEIIKKNKEK